MNVAVNVHIHPDDVRIDVSRSTILRTINFTPIGETLPLVVLFMPTDPAEWKETRRSLLDAIHQIDKEVPDA